MSTGTANTWADLLTPERARKALDHMTTLLEYSDGPSGPFGALPEAAAWSLWIAGPDATRACLEQAVALLPVALRFMPEKLPEPAVLEAVDVGAFERIAACSGAVVPAAPIAGWLASFERRFKELPEIRVSTVLFAIEAGSLDLATTLAKKRLANDSEASVTSEKRAFLLELASSVAKKQRSTELDATWEKVLQSYPIVQNPLRFRPDEIFLVARLLRRFAEDGSANTIARDLHADARRRAGMGP